MIIGVDGNEANVRKKVGVSNYTLHLLNYFQSKGNQNLEFKVFLRDNPLDDLATANEYFTYEIVKGPFLWSQFFLPLKLFSNRGINVFFSPAHYVPRFSPVPTVVTIHDLSYFYYPNDFLKRDLEKLTKWTEYSVKKAKKVIAVSIATKKDIIKFYNIPEDKIEVIYNGYEKITQDRTSEVEEPPAGAGKTSEVKWKKQIRNKQYILYVGTLQPRKNISVLIKAYELFIKENPEYKLVIAGKKGWLFEKIFALVKEKSLEKNVLFLDYVSDEELIYLYKNAFCFVLPSLYEGFGIPILEAMSYNCPVITSYVSSLPEIGGDACLYFDPNNKNELFEKLKLLNENQDLKKELLKKGRERVKLFSWNKCAEQTLEIIIKAYK